MVDKNKKIELTKDDLIDLFKRFAWNLENSLWNIIKNKKGKSKEYWLWSFVADFENKLSFDIKEVDKYVF